MAKKKTAAVIEVNADNLEKFTEKLNQAANNASRTVVILSAALKDDLCNYSYEVIEGIGQGDTHTVKGKGVIDNDLRDAFAKLSVHLAIVDDSYKLAAIDVDRVAQHRGDEIATNYIVTGIKITGEEENKAVELTGTKAISCAGGEMKLQTPRIPLDSTSSYKHHEDLLLCVERVATEVELYMNGKYTPIEEDEDEQLPGQTNLFDQDAEGDGNELEVEFEGAKVD